MARFSDLRGRRAQAAVSVLAAIAGLLATSVLSAQVMPLGPETQVNTYTTGLQALPRIAMAADGSFVVFWCCGYVENEARQAIVGRRFAADGTPLGPEYPVNEHSLDYPSGIAVEGDGEMILVWGAGSYTCPPCIADTLKGRRLAADGTPLGAQFVVSSRLGSIYLLNADVAAHASGGFVVAWDEPGVLARRYATDGEPLGAPFPVDGATSAAQNPAVSELPDGGFVVIWEQPDDDFDFFLRGRRYDADGVPAGEPIAVAEGEPFSAYSPDVATSASGGFVVAWGRDVGPPRGRELEARRFDPAGAPLGPAQPVNSYTTSHQTSPEIRSESDGGYTVVWEGLASAGDPDLWSVHLRRFAADGTPLGREFQMNSYTTGPQVSPQVAVAPNGDLVAVWDSNGSAGTDQDSASIQLRRFRPPFFTDGVESGDTSRWSSATP